MGAVLSMMPLVAEIVLLGLLSTKVVGKATDFSIVACWLVVLYYPGNGGRPGERFGFSTTSE